ncbi:zinc finger BED domain-containing protein 4-like [Diachasma alloeum]|uniref:zinc finger BED domain-containing protein 4-like n=1 Tax=Diachasma alloeum TaxID=454923 RepID=UPI0007384FD7|nr:zinc finger BED domain-containing protein 4-like [Diachasma alloeum]
MVKAAIDTFSEKKHLICFPHTVKLIMQSIIHDIPAGKDLIAKVKRIVTYFRQSSIAAYKQDCPTRWNSTFEMIERFLVLMNAVTCSLLSLEGAPPMLSSAELRLLKEIMDLFKPAKDVTKSISGERYVTGSQLLPLIAWFRAEVAALKPVCDIGRIVKDALEAGIQQRLKVYETKKYQSLIGVAGLLDPRFKRKYFPSNLYDAEVLNLVNVFIKDSEHPNPQVKKAKNPQEDFPQGDALWKHHNQRISQHQKLAAETPGLGTLDINLKQYTSNPHKPPGTDIIKFWLAQKENTPALAKIALKYCCVLGSSVPCERLFSAAARLTEDRSRLTAEHIWRSLFMKSLGFPDWHLS